MKVNRRYVLVLVCLLWTTGNEAVVNVDTIEPIVRRSPALDVDTEDGFGWAVVLHRVEEVQTSDSMAEALRKTRVIVGAPRGTFPGGLNLTDPALPAINQTGLVYSCPVEYGDCEGVRGDTSRYLGEGVSADITNGFQNMASESPDLFIQPISEGRLFDQAPDSDALAGIFSSRQRAERKQDQLMGSFLYSNGENILACAPRWTTSAFLPDGSQPRGICFAGDRNLTNFKTQYPCSGDGSSTSTLFGGYCSAGLSATILSNQVHIGAIGFEESSGAVFSRDLSDSVASPFTQTINHLNEDAPRNQRHASYHGFQVTHGYITSGDRNQSPPDILISSPRDNETMYIGRIYSYTPATLGTIQSDALAEGTQMGEFFGHSIALCDLTGDGYDELLVGAPMYTLLDPLSPEQGRLYVFFNTGGNLDPIPLTIDGNMAGSRFGFTVANLGDIDNDGHEDFAVSAPYESSFARSLSRGAVYIYYGRDTREEFEPQTPQKIHADNIVNSVDGLMRLRTFGFSLSGNIDVDNNQYNDLVIGGYLDQAVVILRSLPVVNVTVDFGDIPDVNVDNPEPSFEVTVRASYVGVNVPGPLSIPFTLSEVLVDGDPRLFFTRGDPADIQGEETIVLPAPSTIGEQTVTVYATSDFRETTPYQLLLQLNDIVRNVPASIDGQQPISDLSSFPRIRLQGNTTRVMVNLINPCGDNGCDSDITLSVTAVNTTLIQGQEKKTSFPLSISNIGSEEARNLRLSISGFPNAVFQQITVSPDIEREVAFTCTRTADAGGNGNVICPIEEDRFLSNQNLSATLTMIVNSSAYVGNEDGFDVTITTIVDTSDNNSDVNTANNQGVISFSYGSLSDINMAMSFGREQYNYEGQTPSTIETSFDLGAPVTLLVRVDNIGPSTIQNALLNVSFPSQVSPESTSQFFLYPSRVTGELSASSAPTSIICSPDGIDPNGLTPGEEFMFQPNARRRKRSVLSTWKANQKYDTLKRRQMPETSNDINCDTHTCLNVICNIQRLTTDGISLTFEFNIDERFFGSLSKKETYALYAMGSVSVLDDFQSRDDNPIDNIDTASVRLVPLEMESTELLHVILWPTIGAFILLVLFVLVLYVLGFFRRKKHEDDEDVEMEDTQPEKIKDEITGL